MILQSVLIYGLLCCVPIVYGIGIKKLLYASYGVRYLVLSFIKSLCTASLSVLGSWLITQYALAPHSSLRFAFHLRLSGSYTHAVKSKSGNST